MCRASLIFSQITVTIITVLTLREFITKWQIRTVIQVLESIRRYISYFFWLKELITVLFGQVVELVLQVEMLVDIYLVVVVVAEFNWRFCWAEICRVDLRASMRFVGVFGVWLDFLSEFTILKAFWWQGLI